MKSLLRGKRPRQASKGKQPHGRPRGKEEKSGEQTNHDLQVFKAVFFRALAHPVRIRILELLAEGDLGVQEIQAALGLEQPLVSQQLAVLRAYNVVSGVREGLRVRYALRDPLLADLLWVAREIFNNHLVSSQELLNHLRDERK